MAYGLSVFKADGSLGFSTADITWQTVAQFTVAANATVSNNSQTITVAPQSGLSSSQCIIHVLAQDA